MHHGHLGQAEHHDQRGEAGDGVAEDDRRARIADRDAAAHEQAGADRAAEADHHDLRPAEPLVKPALARGDTGLIHVFCFFWRRLLVVHGRAALGEEHPHEPHAGCRGAL